MTFAEFLCRVDAYCDHRILHGSPEDTFTTIANGTHPDLQYSSILQDLVHWCAIRDSYSRVNRSGVVNALGPMRLAQNNDSPDLRDYQALIQFIRAVDSAFDDKILDGEPELYH